LNSPTSEILAAVKTLIAISLTPSMALTYLDNYSKQLCESTSEAFWKKRKKTEKRRKRD